MKINFKDLYSNNFFLFFRNNLNIRPLGYCYLKNDVLSVSDFFFWNTRNNFNTKINITNLASQVLPNINQKTNVLFIFYDYQGNIILKKKHELKYFESFSFVVSDFLKNNFGSLAIFQSFKDFKELERQGSYVTEKGYIGYNFENGPWNYVHGNNSTLSYTSNEKIYPLLSNTILKSNSYIPQVRLDDCQNTSLIFNNPLDINLRTTIDLYDFNWKKLSSFREIVKPKNTKILYLGSFEKSYVKINSNMLLFRPMILKKYETYFDIFHG